MPDRSSKYLQQPSQVVANPSEKIDVRFDITELDLLCAYITSDNRAINRSCIMNIKRLLDRMNLEVFNNNPECMKRIEFLNRGIKARLEENLHNRDLILRSIIGGIGTGHVPFIKELDNTEIQWVNNTCGNIIKYADLQAEAAVGMDLCTKLMSSDYSTRTEVVHQFQEWINRVQNQMRRDTIEAAEDMSFSLQPDKLEEVIRETHRHVTSRSNTLRFGTQALNLLTGGGLQAERLYVIFGLPGEGKSATMLDCAMQIKKYNADYVCKDPTKRPCVLLVTMENSVLETFERIYGMTTHTNLKDVITEDEAVQDFVNKGLHLSDDDPIDLVIKFRPGLSEDTTYLYKVIDDLADEGYEVICVFLDYLKRIHSAQGTFNNDFRRELGEITNELKVLATLKQIPVMTASQLNRAATANVDNARIRSKSDLVRIMGRSNIAESNLILENIDWGAQIAPEVDKTGAKYLGIQRIKERYFIPAGFNCAFLPYIPGTLKLVEDLYMPSPVHKDSLASNDEIRLNNGMSSNIIGSAVIRSFDEIDMNSPSTNSANNLFRNASGFAAYHISEPKKRLYHLVDKTQKKRLYHIVRG